MSLILTYRRSYSNEKLLHQNKCKRLKMTYFCIHTLCVRNTYPADDRTILYMCDLNALGGFNFFLQKGAVLAQVTPYELFDAIVAVT